MYASISFSENYISDNKLFLSPSSGLMGSSLSFSNTSCVSKSLTVSYSTIPIEGKLFWIKHWSICNK